MAGTSVGDAQRAQYANGNLSVFIVTTLRRGPDGSTRRVRGHSLAPEHGRETSSLGCTCTDSALGGCSGRNRGCVGPIPWPLRTFSVCCGAGSDKGGTCQPRRNKKAWATRAPAVQL